MSFRACAVSKSESDVRRFPGFSFDSSRAALFMLCAYTMATKPTASKPAPKAMRLYSVYPLWVGPAFSVLVHRNMSENV